MPRKKKPYSFKNCEGVEYEVFLAKPNSHHYGDADGTCAPPTEEVPKIRINPYLNKQSELNTAIHEFTHAFFWQASEKKVFSFANALSRFLYNHCKWRKVRPGKYKKGEVHKSNLLEKERTPKNERGNPKTKKNCRKTRKGKGRTKKNRS